MYPKNGRDLIGKTDALDRLVRKDIVDTNDATQVKEHISDIKWSELGDMVAGRNVVSYNASDFRNEKAANQGFWSGLYNGVAQTIKAAPFRVMAAAGEMLDIGDYFNGSGFDKMFGDGKDEYGNFFSNWIRDNVVSSIEKTNAVHKYDDVSLLGTSPTDAKWWNNLGADITSLAGSATEFVGAGFGVGALVSKGLRTAGMITSLGKTVNGEKAITGLERLLTATAENQAEALGSSADLYDKTYKQAIANGETMGEAETKAGIAASTNMNMNRINIAMNLTSVGIFGMGMFGTRAVAESASLMGWEGWNKLSSYKNLGMEAGQEFLEEVNSFAAEKAGETAAERGKAISLAESFGDEGMALRANAIKEDGKGALEAGLLGAFGGVAQTTASTGLASSKILAGVQGATGSETFGKYTGKIFGVDAVVFDENGNPKEKERGANGEFMGYETERITKAESNKRRYDRQQKLGKDYEDIFSKENSTRMWDTFESAERQQELYVELKEAQTKGDAKKVRELKDTMLQERAYEAFETGTAGLLLGAMESEVNRHISEQEKIDRGLPEDYKKNLQAGISMVKELEKTFIESKMFKDSGLIYATKANNVRAKRYKNEMQTRFADKRNAFNLDISEAISDGRLAKSSRKSTKEVITRKRAGEPLTSAVEYDRTIEDIIGGDYAGVLNGEVKIAPEDKSVVDEFMNEVSKLFPTELQELGKLVVDIRELTDLEYSYKEAYNSLRSGEYQKKAAIKEEIEAATNAAKTNEIELQKKKDAEVAKQNKAKDDKKRKADEAEALNALNEAKKNSVLAENEASEKEIDAEETESSSVDNALLNDDIPDMEQGTRDGETEFLGGDTLEGGYDPDDTRNENNLTTVEYRGNSGKNKPAMNIPSKNKPQTSKEVQGQSENNPKDKNAKAKQDAKKEILDKMKGIIDGLIGSESPSDKKRKINLDSAAIKQLIDLNQQLIEQVFENEELSWAEMLQEWVDMYGSDWTKKAYPYIVSIFGATVGEHITTTYAQTLGLSGQEVSDIRDIHDKFEKEIDEDFYSADTEDRQLDKGEALVFDSYADALESDSYETYEEEGGKDRKTYTGYNILAYVAISPEIDNASTEGKRKELFDNMENPLLLSTNHFGVGTELHIEPANNDEALVVNKFQKGKKTTFAQFKIDAAKALGADSSKYKWALLEEEPMTISAIVNGEKYQIGYVHGVSWINSKNVSKKRMSLKDQKIELMKMREAVLKQAANNKPFTSKITAKLPGKLIFRKDKQGKLIADKASVAIPSDVQLSIGTRSGFDYGTEDADNDTMSDDTKAVPAGVYAMLPVNSGGTTKTIASPLMMNTLSDKIVATIEQAILAYMDKKGAYNSLKTKLNDTAGIDLNTPEGLETYIKQFIYTLSFNKTKGSIGSNAVQRFINYAQGYLGKNKVYVQMINGKLYMGRGSGYSLTDTDAKAPGIIEIHKDMDAKELASQMVFFKEMLKSYMYVKASKDGLNSKNVELWGITENGIANFAPKGDYNQFLKENSTSFVSGINVGTEENPDYVYAVQSIVEMDTNAEQGDAKPIEKKEIVKQDVSINPMAFDTESDKKDSKTPKQELSDAKADIEKRREELVEEGLQELNDGKFSEIEIETKLSGWFKTVWGYVRGIYGGNVSQLFDTIIGTDGGADLDKIKSIIKISKIGKAYSEAMSELEITINRANQKQKNRIEKGVKDNYPEASMDRLRKSADEIIALNNQALSEAIKFNDKLDAELAALESKDITPQTNKPKAELTFDEKVDATWKWAYDKFVNEGLKAVKKSSLKTKDKDRNKMVDKVWARLAEIGAIKLNKKGWVDSIIAPPNDADIPEVTEKSKLPSNATELEKLSGLEQFLKDDMIKDIQARLPGLIAHQSDPKVKKVLDEELARLKALGADLEEDMDEDIEEELDDIAALEAANEENNSDDEYDDDDINYFDDNNLDVNEKGKNPSQAPRILTTAEKQNIVESLEEILIPELGAARQADVVTNITSSIISSTFEEGKSVTISEAVEEEIRKAQARVDKANEMLPRLQKDIDKGVTKIKGRDIHVLYNMYASSKFLFQAVVDNKHKLTSMVIIKMHKMKGITVNQKEATSEDTSNLTKDQLDENASFTTDSKKTVGANVKKFLATLIDKKWYPSGGYIPVTNWTGAFKIMEFDEVFNTLSGILEGVRPEYDEVIAALKADATVFGWIDDLIKKLERAKAKNDLTIVNEFMVAMSKHQINMKFVYWEYSDKDKGYIAKVTDSNQAALGKSIQYSWYDGLLRSGNIQEIEGKKSFHSDAKALLISEFESIRSFKLPIDKDIVPFDDVRAIYTGNEIKEIGQSILIDPDKIPEGNSLSKATNLPTVVSMNSLVLRVERAENGGILITKLSPSQTPEELVKRNMLKGWLAKLGIQLDDKVLEKLDSEGIRLPGEKKPVLLRSWLSPTNNHESNPLYHLYKSLKLDSIIDLENNKSIMIHDGIKAMASMQAKYENKVFSNSFQAGKKSVYTYTANKYATDRLRDLKTNTNLINNLMSLDFSKASLWLRDFINKDGKSRVDNSEHGMKLGYVSLQAIKQKGAKNRDDKSLLDVSPADHEWYKMALFMDMKEGNNGNGERICSFLYPSVPAEKSSRFVIQNKAYKVGFKGDSVNNTTLDLFYDHIFMAEYKRILEHQKTGNIGQAEYDDGANYFYFFPKLNTLTKLRGVDGKILDVSDAAIKEAVKKVIKETIDDAVSAKLKSWDKYRFTKGGKDGIPLQLKYVDQAYIKHINDRKPQGMNEVTAAAYDFEVNQIIANVNMFQMFIGDPAVFFKESQATDNVTPLLKRHLMVQEWIKSEGGNVDKYVKNVEANKVDPESKWNTLEKALTPDKLAVLSAIVDLKLKGDKANNIPAMSKIDKMVAISKLDPVLANKYSNNLIKEVFNNVGKRLSADVAPGHDLPDSKDEKVKYLFLQDNRTKSINKEYLETLKLKGFGDYSKIKGADAQEYTTWQEHLHVMLKIGKISQAKHDAWTKKIKAGTELNEAELLEVLQPMKPVYTGNIAEINKGFERRIFIKSSAFPLLPQLTKGLEIDKLRLLMNKHKISRAAMATAVKVGMPSSAINIFDTNHDFNSKLTDEQIENATLNLPRTNFRIQMEVPYKESKDNINVGTQERKLLFTNIRGIEGFSYNGRDDWDGQELEDEYNRLYADLFKRKYDKLMKRIIHPETKELDKVALQKILKEEAESRGYPLADVLGLDTVINSTTGEVDFIIPLWANPSHKAFESLMISVVQNNINKMKFNGGSFVIGSEEGFKVFGVQRDDEGNLIENSVEEHDKLVTEQVKKYDGHMAWTKNWQGKLYPAGKFWTNADKSRRYTGEEYRNLKDDDYKASLTEQILPSQVLLPSKFRGRDGNLIDMKRYVNPNTGVIDQQKIPKELMEFFEFRIPTQGHNSMSWAEIVGFLPPDSGDLMILSRDLTIQKGLDFDVDKEYVYFPHMKEVFDDQDPEVLLAKSELEAAFELHVGKELLDEKKELRAYVKANPWYDRQFTSEKLMNSIKDKVPTNYHKVLRRMSEDDLNYLHQSGYTKHYGEFTPVNIKYSGKTLEIMRDIKSALTEVAAEYENEIGKPYTRLKEITNILNQANNVELIPFKEKLKAVRDSKTKFRKIGNMNDTNWLFVDGKTLNAKTNEPIKVRVLTNDRGDILNEEELAQSGMITELQLVYPGNVIEGFRDFATKSIQDKVDMNKILEIHKAIMMHEDVQKYIHEPLAFGDLKGNFNISKRINDALNDRADSATTFTPMSSEFQRDKLTSGLAGRVGIGSFSLDSVMISQLQNKNVVIKESFEGEDGKTIHQPVYIQFGDKSTSITGDVSSIGLNQQSTGTRFDTITAFQSAAVDNENEQILDKINANKHTFAAIRALAAFGFNEVLISTFLSQDAIWHYVEQMGLSESEVSKAFGKVDIDTIIEQYEELHSIKWESSELNHRKYPAYIDAMGTEELFANIKTGPGAVDYYKDQAAILRKFKFISELGSVQLQKMQGVLKVDSSGFGGNFLEISDKYDDFMELLDSKQYDNIKNMIGDIIDNREGELNQIRILELEAAGYVGIGNDWEAPQYYIKPSTVMGNSLVYGLQTANRLFKDIIPYSKIKTALNEIITNSKGKTLSTQDLVDMFDDMKSFIFTHDDSQVIVSERFKINNSAIRFSSIAGTRNKLLKDVKGAKGVLLHASLATVLHQLKNSLETNIVQTNPFLSRLTTREVEGGINLIEFNASVDRGIDDSAIYAGFADLLADTIKLPDVNGIPYNTTQLAQDLIAYSYMMGGVQGATNFMRYIPIHYLTQLGFNTGTKDIMNEMVKADGKPTSLLYRFYTQYIQNNPDKAPITTEYATANAAKGKVGLVKKGTKVKTTKGESTIYSYEYQGKKGEPEYGGMFIAVNRTNAGADSKQVVSPTGFKLFKWNKERNAYFPISTAGTNIMPEYDAMNDRTEGINTIFEKWRGVNVAGRKDITNISPNDITLQTRWEDYGTPEEYVERHKAYLNYVKDYGKNPSLSMFADFFLQGVEEMGDIALLVDNKMPSRGYYSNDEKKLKFNEWSMSKHSKYEKSKTIIHEYVHTSINKYFEMDMKDLTPKQAKAVATLNRFHKDFVDKMKAEGKYDAMINRYNNGGLTQSQVDVDYAAFDVREFITLAMTSKPFQEELKAIPSGKTNLFEKLMKFMADFFKAIGMKDAEGTRLEETFAAVFTLTDFDMKMNMEEYMGDIVATEGEVDNTNETTNTDNNSSEEATTKVEKEEVVDDLSFDDSLDTGDIKPKTVVKAKMKMAKPTREKNPNADLDDISLSPNIKVDTELKEGANRTLRVHNLFEEAKKLMDDGRLEFDCKKQ